MFEQELAEPQSHGQMPAPAGVGNFHPISRTAAPVLSARSLPRLAGLQSTSGKVIGFDQLLIAMGSSVRWLKVPGANRSEVFYLREMKDSQAI